MSTREWLLIDPFVWPTTKIEPQTAPPLASRKRDQDLPTALRLFRSRIFPMLGSSRTVIHQTTDLRYSDEKHWIRNLVCKYVLRFCARQCALDVDNLPQLSVRILNCTGNEVRFAKSAIGCWPKRGCVQIDLHTEVAATFPHRISQVLTTKSCIRPYIAYQ